jgi:phosphatidylglycerophosphate synthase
MNKNCGHDLKIEAKNPSSFSRNLADLLTFSRVIIALIILSLSFAGKSAYMAVIILTLAGAATDMLDGKVARHYLGESGEGRLGKYDAVIDTFFVLCVLGYFSLSQVVIPEAIGLSWIVLILTAYVVFKRNNKVLAIAEVVTVIALLAITLVYSPPIFWLVIVPVMTLGIIVNRRRVVALISSYLPSLFSE